MIHRVRLHTAIVPMATGFDHASHSRRQAESVLVEVTLAGGAHGWGEGAPRRYVTGEMLGTAADTVPACDLADLAERIDWRMFDSAVESLAVLDFPEFVGRRAAPAAAAAVEIALLDAVCRHFDRPLSDVLHPFGLRRTRPAAVPISLVLDLSRDVASALDGLSTTTRAALRHVKIKVEDPAGAVERLAQARDRLGDNTGISLDVNGNWSVDEAEAVAGELTHLGVAWVEEPLPPRSWPLLARLRQRTGLPVMLDESCGTLSDLNAAAGAGAASHINVRLSKCGGVFAAARLAARAQELGLGCQLGVHVAEVGPLWAAGRALATSLGQWETVEVGRADEWFPEPLTRPAFAADRTNYRVAPLPGPGTGVVPSAALLRHTRCRVTWRRDTGWRMEEP